MADLAGTGALGPLSTFGPTGADDTEGDGAADGTNATSAVGDDEGSTGAEGSAEGFGGSSATTLAEARWLAAQAGPAVALATSTVDSTDGAG